MEWLQLATSITVNNKKNSGNINELTWLDHWRGRPRRARTLGQSLRPLSRFVCVNNKLSWVDCPEWMEPELWTICKLATWLDPLFCFAFCFVHPWSRWIVLDGWTGIHKQQPREQVNLSRTERSAKEEVLVLHVFHPKRNWCKSRTCKFAFIFPFFCFVSLLDRDNPNWFCLYSFQSIDWLIGGDSRRVYSGGGKGYGQVD